MTILGFVLAVWSVTGAMNAYMLAINIAYEQKDRRSFVKKRIVALKMAVVIGLAFALVAVLTIFGPVVEHSIATRIGPAGGVLNVLWWIAPMADPARRTARRVRDAALPRPRCRAT